MTTGRNKKRQLMETTRNSKWYPKIQPQRGSQAENWKNDVKRQEFDTQHQKQQPHPT